MMRPLIACLWLVTLPLACSARPMPAASIPAPSALCRAAILQAEQVTHVPDRLLDAIGVVESGRRDPVSGAVYPWPWTINAEGIGHFYESKAEAVAAAEAFQARGVRSMDIGCTQVNILYHAEAFANLDQAFDPIANAAYAARFLQKLFAQTNAWPLAAAAYHSFTPDLGADYARKVLAAWGVPQLPIESQAVTHGSSPASIPIQAAAVMPAAPSRVAVMLPSAGSEAIRVLPLPGGGGLGGGFATSRSLDSYRSMPVNFASRGPRAS